MSSPGSLRDLRIGYVPYSSSLTRPGDRRRFCYYAAQRGINFAIARPTETYDLVVVTAGGDISVWSRYHRGDAKIIYEQLDSYLAVPQYEFFTLFRGIAKFVVRQNRRLLLNYNDGIREMCRRADAVLCCSPEQKQELDKSSSNVHVIPDFHGTVVRHVKRDYACGDVFNLVWEGLPGLSASLYEIADVLREISARRPLALHVVTALEYGRFLGGVYGKRNTLDLLRDLGGNVFLYAWNEEMCSRIITACDLAVIPIPLHDPLLAGKPENKLILLWRMAMPVLVSATPAYSRAMQESNIQMACRADDDWRDMLARYMSDEQARRSAGERGRVFAEEHYSETCLLGRWDAVLQGLFPSLAAFPADAPQALRRNAGTTM